MMEHQIQSSFQIDWIRSCVGPGRVYRDDRCCSHPNTRIGIISVDWFQIETKFYFGNHWMENRDFHVTIVQ